MATISKTSTFEVPKFLSEFFSPSFRWVLPVACLGPRLPRQHTAAHGSRQRQRFRGPAAPGGEGGRGCTERQQLWPRRGILVRKPHEALGFHCEEVNEDVDGLLMVPLFGGYCQLFYLFGKRVQTFASMFGVVVCDHNYIVPTLWVGVFLTQGF